MVELNKDQLNAEQRAAVEHGEGPLLIVAGAGTGKTHVIVERVGYLLRTAPGLEPENILALTFARKAAEEMRRRAGEYFGERALGCRFSTFHAFCYDLLREEIPLRALDKIDQWIFFRRHLEELELDYYLKVSEPGRFLHDLVDFCSRCHDNLVSPVQYSQYVEKLAAEVAQLAKQGRPPGKDAEQEIARLREHARVYERSETLQKQEYLLSFGAMISMAVSRLNESPQLLRQLQQRYAYILVDEFQDTNAAQWELLKLLAGKRRNVTVVGDDYQAIYRFRGASDGSLEQFRKKDFPTCERKVLNQNYRSTKSILNVAHAVARKLDSYKEDKRLVTKKKDQGCTVEVWEFPDAGQQSEFVAQEIARQIQAGEAKAYSDFAVLYRAHRYRNRLVEALRRREVPFAIRNLAIDNLPPVRDMVACLRAIGRPEDSVSLARVLAGPRWEMEASLLWEGCRLARERQCSLREVVEDSGWGGQWPGKAKLLGFLSRYQKLSREQRLLSWFPLLRQELDLFGLKEEGDDTALGAFTDFVIQWDQEKSTAGLLGEFLEYFGYFEEAGGRISLPDEDDPAPTGAASLGESRQGTLWDQSAEAESLGKVQLMTVHGAKGLEFENVFVLHLLRRAFPTSNRRPLISLPDALWKGSLLEGDFHIEEERRLFYVALTRARSTLTLCTVSNKRQQPSRFLDELRNDQLRDEQLREDKDGGSEIDWKKLSAPTEPVLQALRQEDTIRQPPFSQIERWTGAMAAPPAGSLTLSASGLDTYRQCPRKYQYSYVCRLPVSPSPALLFGSIMHRAVRELVSRLAAGRDASNDASRNASKKAGGDAGREVQQPETVEAILDQHWSSAGFTDPHQESKYKEMGREQLAGLKKALEGQPFQLLHQEKGFQFSVKAKQGGGTKLLGRIDQINQLAGQDVELIEYKTGRAQTQKEADRSLQLTLYALACREVLGLKPLSLVLYNLTTQEGFRTTRGPDDFKELQGQIRQVSRDILAGKFPALPGYHCRYCDFRPICPAYEDSRQGDAVPG
ncbi:MAG: ATP-dependent helicase [Acidobacteria bacterium]|nr:ATP-dependent helicase [Acidobacteriota bacterium]